jgi:uncharacterized protein (DUF58 family)
MTLNLKKIRQIHFSRSVKIKIVTYIISIIGLAITGLGLVTSMSTPINLWLYLFYGVLIWILLLKPSMELFFSSFDELKLQMRLQTQETKLNKLTLAYVDLADKYEELIKKMGESETRHD